MVERMDGDHGSAGDGWRYVPTPAMPDAETYSRVGIFVVNGETFAVRTRESDGSLHYDWLSGPHDGYGFSISGGSTPLSHEWHEAAILGFLAGIDPATGYLSYP